MPETHLRSINEQREQQHGTVSVALLQDGKGWGTWRRKNFLHGERFNNNIGLIIYNYIKSTFVYHFSKTQ